MLSNYHGSNNLVNANSPLQAALRSPLLETHYAQGVRDTASNDTSGIEEAAAVAAGADVAVVFVGLSPCNGWRRGDPCNEGESHDRTWSYGVQVTTGAVGVRLTALVVVHTPRGDLCVVFAAYSLLTYSSIYTLPTVNF